MADRVEEGLDRYRREHGITGTWAARDRVVVALTGGPEGPMLLRRGARIAGRVAGRDLVAVHVVRSDGTVGAPAAEIERQRLLAENLGGSLHLIVGDDIAATVLDFARGVNGTQIVVGASRHGRFAQLVRPSTANAIVRGSGDIDVHVVTHQQHVAPIPAARVPILPARPIWPWVAAVLFRCVLAGALLPLRDELACPTVLLIFLLGVLATALIGGVLPAAVAALIAGALANLLFTPPYGSLTIAEPDECLRPGGFRGRRGDAWRPSSTAAAVGAGSRPRAGRSPDCSRPWPDQRAGARRPGAGRAGTGQGRIRDDSAALLSTTTAAGRPAAGRRRHPRWWPVSASRWPTRAHPHGRGRRPCRSMRATPSGCSRCTGTRWPPPTSAWPRCSPPRRCWPSTATG